MKENGEKNAWKRKAAILLFWLVVWQLAAVWLNRPIFLVGPWETLKALGRLAGTASFWRCALSSFGRISAGFGLAFLLGIVCGSLAYAKPLFGEILAPVVNLIKTIPVASFVILALIWAGADHLTLVISFVVVFPILYVNTVSGLCAADPQLLEMSRVFRVRPPAVVWNIYRPALAPYLLSACRLALGMSWKSGVAAEVIGTPDYSIGEKLYMAKVFFGTDELFAWTTVIIVLSYLFEKVIMAVLQRISRVNP